MVKCIVGAVMTRGSADWAIYTDNIRGSELWKCKRRCLKRKKSGDSRSNSNLLFWKGSLWLRKKRRNKRLKSRK